MPNVLQNVFKTSGLNGQQPWKQFYKGIKPVNPLGGDVVRRMGNKVKSVVSSTNTKNMQFSYMTDIAEFKSDPGYIPPYKPLPGQQPPQYYSIPQSSPPYTYGGYYPEQPSPVPPYPLQGNDPYYYEKMRRQSEKDARERRREARQSVTDTRDAYRSSLGTVREVRNWATTLGMV